MPNITTLNLNFETPGQLQSQKVGASTRNRETVLALHALCLREKELTKKMFKLDALAEDDHAKRRPILVEIQESARG